MSTNQPHQVTVNDIIHSDERVIQLKKTYQEFANKKNQLIFDISHVEAEIIKTMGAFEYLNQFAPEDVVNEKNNLLPTFRTLITKKNNIIKEIAVQDNGMKGTEATFNKLADEIVKDLQKQFRQPGTASCPESGESCPESAPEDECCGGCNECKCHEAEGHIG